MNSERAGQNDLSCKDVATLKNALLARDKQLSALQHLMSDLLADKSLITLLHSMTDMMRSCTGATQAWILLTNDTHDCLEVAASSGITPETDIGNTGQRGVGFTGVAWSTGQTQYIANSDANKQARGYWPVDTQLIAVPITVAGIVVGVSVLGAPSQSSNLNESISVIDHLALMTSYALAAAERIEKTEKDLQSSRGMKKISHLMTTIKDVDQLIDSVSSTLVELLNFSQCTFYTVAEDQELRSHTTWAKTADGVKTHTGLPLDAIEESACFWSYKNKETVCIQAGASDYRESERVQTLRTDLGMGCTITIPVIVSGDVFAVAMISKDSLQKPTDENELNFIASIMQQFSAAVYGINATNALRYRVYHDSLTNLPNRRQFEDSLHTILKQRKPTDNVGALLFLDLDGFKTINDTLGHSAGDTLLQLVAKRLQSNSPHSSVVSRTGGNEYSVILPSVETSQEAFRIAQNIRQAILNPFVIGKSVANIGTSIGLCFFPTHGESVDDVCRHADVALYQAKIGGKNNVVCFDEYMARDVKKKQLIETELHDALAQKQFLLHFQPQVDPVEKRVMGVEALIRWHHPQHGLVSPAEFIPVAEETGLINEIGAWVLEEAITQIAAWQSTPLSHLKVSVNVAAPQFLIGDISSRINEQLKQHNVSPALLEVELTESVVMEDIDLVAIQLKALQDLGVTVALDDFGTGYSSLSYLQDLPLDVLKIDRAFVARLTDEKTHYSLVNTIMLLASGLGLHTVAEGVETSSQLDQIVDLGCNLVQGFYYSKPCTSDQLLNAVNQIEDQHGCCEAA